VVGYAVAAPVLGYALFRAVERRLRQNGRWGNIEAFRNLL